MRYKAEINKKDYIWSSFSLVFLLIAASWFNSTQDFKKNALSAKGTVIEIITVRGSDGDTYKPKISFTTQTGEGIIFTRSYSSKPVGYKRNQIVDILYNPENPQQAKIDGFFSLNLGVIILSSIGIIWFAIGFGIIAYKKYREKQINLLYKRGKQIETEIIGSVSNTSHKAKGRTPWIIQSQWLNPNTNEVHLFESVNLWFDPESFMKDRETITVYCQRDNLENYHMDVGFLPRRAK